MTFNDLIRVLEQHGQPETARNLERLAEHLPPGVDKIVGLSVDFPGLIATAAALCTHPASTR
jgi:hypothetical protein